MDSNDDEHGLFSLPLGPPDLHLHNDETYMHYGYDDMEWHFPPGLWAEGGLNGQAEPDPWSMDFLSEDIATSTRVLELDRDDDDDHGVAAAAPGDETDAHGLSGAENPRVALGLASPPTLDSLSARQQLLPCSVVTESQSKSTSSGESSPWVITTPVSTDNGSSPILPHRPLPITKRPSPTPAQQPIPSAHVVSFDPRTRVWVVPKARLFFSYAASPIPYRAD